MEREREKKINEMDNVIMNINRDTLSDIYKNQCIGQHLSKIMNGEVETGNTKSFST